MKQKPLTTRHSLHKPYKPYQPCLLVLLALLTLCSCGNRRTATANTAVDTVTFKYARLIHIEHHDAYTVARVDNPWKPGKALHTYVLVPYGAEQPEALPQGTVVRTPLRRSIIFTSVHAALVDVLGAQRQVAGVADRKYIKVPFVQQGCADGTLADCGDGMNPLVEKIIDAEADAILLSPFENSGGYGRLEDISIPLIECAEYMEASPLARAEWMRFYGMLYGQERRADSLFAAVDSSYHALRRLAATSATQPTVLMDKQTGSVWYVPGGKSTIGKLIVDASASYPWSENENSGSVALPFESVLEKAQDADVWLFRYNSPQPATFSSLLSENKGYAQFKSFANKEVYGCNTATSTFYEDTPFHPYSPYAVAKLYGYWIIKEYREAYGMYCCSGILFNHESERRGETFVTRKITLAAARIAQGKQDKLYLGNMSSLRDWGYAKDYVECMWMILQQDEPDDFVIATGVQHSVREFCSLAFRRAGIELDFVGEGADEKGVDKATGRVLVEVSNDFYRPTDVVNLCGDPTKARTKLGWNPSKTTFEDLVNIMVDHDMKKVAADGAAENVRKMNLAEYLEKGIVK